MALIYEVSMAAEQVKNLLSDAAKKEISTSELHRLIEGDYSLCHDEMRHAAEKEDNVARTLALNEVENAMLFLKYWSI